MGTYWKPAKDEEIVRLYVEERLSLRTIGKLVGLSYEGVAKRLRANNVEPRRRGGPAVLRTPGKATEFAREELLRLYHVERLPLAEIADRLNLSERQVIAHATKLSSNRFPRYFRKRKLPEAWQLK